jgi:hypothetical protein
MKEMVKNEKQKRQAEGAHEALCPPFHALQTGHQDQPRKIFRLF